MSDGTESAALEAPEAASQEVVQETADLQPELGQDGDAEIAVEDDSEEIEHDGAKYKIPKAVKPLLMFQADYTRKTQDVARQREAIEARAAEVAREAEVRKGLETDIGRLSLIDERLTEFQKVDWAAARAVNPEQANNAFQEYVMLRDQRENLATKVQRDIHERSQKAQQDFAKRYAETMEVLARDIKGFNQDLADKLRDFAIASGMSRSELETVATNAPMAKLLYKAFLGEQLSTAKPPKPPSVEPKPVAKVTGASPKTSVNLFDADMENYVAARKKQGFGRR